MKKIRAAIVGYGNIGQYVLDAILSSPDFEVAGIVRRDPNNVPDELKKYPVVKTVKELKDVEVAILCTPTRSVEEYAKECLVAGINTVDSYDIHGGIVALRKSLDTVANLTTQCLSFQRDGTRVQILWCVPCLNLWRLKVSHIQISVRV